MNKFFNVWAISQPHEYPNITFTSSTKILVLNFICELETKQIIHILLEKKHFHIVTFHLHLLLGLSTYWKNIYQYLTNTAYVGTGVYPTLLKMVPAITSDWEWTSRSFPLWIILTHWMHQIFIPLPIHLHWNIFHWNN